MYRRATPLNAVNFQPTLVAFDHMFDDGQTKPGATQSPAASAIDTVKPLCQPWDMVCRYAITHILDNQFGHRRGPCRAKL